MYSTYLGGRGEDGSLDLALDASGNAYVTGYTYSRDFPTVNAAQPAFGGAVDAFVAKFDASGIALVYATYLGGNDTDVGRSLAVDAAGHAYVAGSTGSSNFPTAAARQAALAGGADAFLVKLLPTGSGFVYSTLLGGSGTEEAYGVAVDTAGNAYVTGITTSTDFPTANPLQPRPAGGPDAFVTKLNDTGSTLLYSTYLGGSRAELRPDLAIDGAGQVYVTGSTESADFPTVNPVQAGFGGGRDLFVAKVRASGAALDYATYLGGAGVDTARGIAVDRDGAAYVTGATTSANFPITNPVQRTSGGRSDAVIVKLAAP